MRIKHINSDTSEQVSGTDGLTQIPNGIWVQSVNQGLCINDNL